MSKRAGSGGTSRFDGLILAIALFLSLEGFSNSVTAQQAQAPLAVHRSQATGLATFVTARDGGAIPVAGVAAAQAQPMDFLRAYGRLFGVTNPDGQLVVARVDADRLGQTHTTYHQIHKGVSVFSGVLKVHQTADGSFRAANGNFYPIRDTLNAVPTLTKDQATARALDAVSAGQPAVEHSELVIVDPGWYGDPPIGAHLAYYIILADPSVPLREAFFVNAHKGNVLDHWNLLDASLDRVVIDDSQAGDPIVRAEGDGPAGDFDADSAYDYSGDTYDFLFRAFGRDSYDDAGGTLTAVVHLVSSRCPNAFGGGGASFFCDGTATDDIVAHEWGHSIMDFTANLIYQHQPGQLNESYSDVWGELIDLFNGNAGFAGPPGGTSWPVDANYIGPGTDTPNTLRTGCVSGAFMTVNSPGSIAGDYLAKRAAFGPALTIIGTSADIVVADPVRACDVDLPFSNAAAMNGKIVLVDRGDCLFTEKVKNAQDEGAIAVIVANNLSAGLPPMGGSDVTVVIPSVGIGQADGGLVKTEVQSGTVNVTLRINANPDVRWLIGEDSSGFGGAIRDMWQPSCAGHPDTANHPFQTCNPNDNGGVHSGSGVPNHAFAMLCDGKTFNGFTVNAIGPIKAAAVWYRALNVYLTVASNFQDAYAALNQAAADLVGNSVFDPRDGSVFATFTAADAVEVDKALRAVEMNTEGLCGSQTNILDSTPPVKCPARSVLFSDDFESGVGGWTVSNSGPFGPPTPYDWEQISGGLPVGWPGTVWFVADANIGDCGAQDESAVHSLFTPTIALPADLPAPTLAFSHFMESETFFDGGNIKIRVNAGSWQIIPKSAFQFNGYNSALRTSGNTNPMAGQEAWTGFALETRQWGTSLVDLSNFVSGGEDVQLRFDFGKDGCNPFEIAGWFVDDFELYTCPEVSKFSQRPDETGEDIPSNIDWVDEDPNVVVADDFVSDGRPITAVRWWGSNLEVDEKSCDNPWVCGAPFVECAGNPDCICTTGPGGAGVCIDALQASCSFPCPNGDADCSAGLKCDGGLSCCGGPVCVPNCPDVPQLTVQAEVGTGAMDYLGVETLEPRAGGPVPVRCTEVPTGRFADGDFWGWHSTDSAVGASIGLGVAQSSIVTMSGADWLYGPWNPVTPACSQPNMAFELLTTTPPAGDPDANDNGIPDKCEENCGDGLITGAEECDDGNASNNDDCLNDCTAAGCGDSFVWNEGSGTEECDDGGESAACDADCTAVECGDDTLNVTAGEECDGVDDATCPGLCQADCTCIIVPDPLEGADDGLGGDYNRVGDFKMPTSAVAGGHEVAIRVKLIEMYKESHGCSHDATVTCRQDADCQPGGACEPDDCGPPNATCELVNSDGCPNRSPPLPDLTDFNGQVRYLGPPEVFSNNDVKANKWVGAKLQCTPLVRDWSAAALQADLGNRCSNDLSQTCTANNQCGDDDDICVPLDADTIYYYGAEVVPCSTHAVQQGTQSCVDLANEEDCLSDPLEVRTALWGDIWPIPGGFGANVNFGDIGNEVDAFKGIPFLIGGPDGAANKWRSMLRDNEGAPDGSINFTDIGKTVNAFKTIAYREAGPTACP